MLRRIGEYWRDILREWAWPVALALCTAAAMWAVWYYTKVPCIMARAEMGLCNPGVLAGFINIDVLAKSGGGGLAVGALKGGYDRYMLTRELRQEREARRLAEEQLAEARQQAQEQLAEARLRADEARQRADEARQRADEARLRADEAVAEERRKADAAHTMVSELIAEFREERRRYEEDRRQDSAAQQAMLETLRQLLQQQNNGGQPAANAAETPTRDEIV